MLLLESLLQAAAPPVRGHVASPRLASPLHETSLIDYVHAKWAAT